MRRVLRRALLLTLLTGHAAFAVPPTADTGRELSRTFKCFDHADEGVEGFVTITGGKATTLRGMAEAAADVVVQKLGLDAPCRTREVELLPFEAYYAIPG